MFPFESQKMYKTLITYILDEKNCTIQKLKLPETEHVHQNCRPKIKFHFFNIHVNVY